MYISCRSFGHGAQAQGDLGAQRSAAELKAQQDARNTEALLKMEETLEKARQTQSTNPDYYVEALLNLASFNRRLNNKVQADEQYREALAFSEDHRVGCSHLPYDAFFRYVELTSSEPDFDKRFYELITVCEKDKYASDADLDNAISNMTSPLMSHLMYDNVPQTDQKDQAAARKRAHATMKLIWKDVIAVRSLVRGINDKSLIEPYVSYSSFCDESDPKEAEQAMLKADSLTPPSDKTQVAMSKTRVAEFYINQKVFDKAEQYWRSAVQIMNNHLDNEVGSDLVGLAKTYKQADRPTDMFKVANVVLADCGEPVVGQLDELMSQIVDDCIHAGQIPAAEAWLKKRLAMSERLGNDPATNDWRIKLSDVELAEGKTAEAEKLYQQVLQSQALQGIPTDSLTQNRAALLERLGRDKQSQAIRKTLSPAPSGPILIHRVGQQ